MAGSTVAGNTVAGSAGDSQELQRATLGPQAAPGIALGVSAAATSSSRWRRMLDPVERGARSSAQVLASRARTLTFIVGPETVPGADVEMAGFGLEILGNPSDGIVIEVHGLDAPAAQERVRGALAQARTGWRFRVIGD